MRIAIICNSTLALPFIMKLAPEKQLVGLGVSDKNQEALHTVETIANTHQISFEQFGKENLEKRLTNWLQAIKADLLLVITFPYRLPSGVLSVPPKGCFNVHFAKLPEYRGSEPVFWQILNREEKGAISIHKMTENFDEGPLYSVTEVPFYSEDTYGMHMTNASIQATQALQDFLSTLNQDREPQIQDEQLAHYWKKPDENDLTIKWSIQTSEEIHALVRAANPVYEGARALLNGMPLRILEVSSAQVNNAPEVQPGTIIYADTQQGIFVACKDNKFLRINIVAFEQGIMSGNRLAGLGVQAGQQFTLTQQELYSENQAEQSTVSPA